MSNKEEIKKEMETKREPHKESDKESSKKREKENHSKVSEKKKENEIIKIVFSTLVLVTAFLFEFYLFVNPSQNIHILVCWIVLIVSAYILSSSIFSYINKENKEKIELLNELMKAEKANYALSKSNQQRLEKLEKSEEQKESPITRKELLDQQKSLAKLVVGKNKESLISVVKKISSIEKNISDTLEDRQLVTKKVDELNLSYNLLIDKINDLSKIIEKNNEGLLTKQELFLEQNSKSLLIKNQEILTEIKSMESQINAKLSNITSGTVSRPVILEESLPKQENTEAKIEKEIETSIETATVEEKPEEKKEEPPVPAYQPSDDPNHKMTPDEIAALIASTTAAEEKPEEKKEEPPVPAYQPSDDPNHVMTPEEIAALIASTT